MYSPAVVRNILSVVTGVIAAGVVVAVVEGLGQWIWPPGEGFDPANPDMSLVPTMTVVMVGAAWFLGPTVGGLMASRIARTSRPTLALVVGALFMAADIAILMLIPSPAWLWVVGIAAPIAGAYLGYLGGRVDREDDAAHLT